MISPTSTTTRYALQPVLIEGYKKTLEWLSSVALWKQEFTFFQKLLDKYAVLCTSLEDRQQISHFQNIITYYKGELIDTIGLHLRQHEKKLADLLATGDETKTEYFSEHASLIESAELLGNQIHTHKEALFSFIEKLIKTNK